MINKLELQKIELTNYLPEELQDGFRKHAYIAGGAVYCYINDIKINDFDFFLKDKKFAKKVRDYFTSEYDKGIPLELDKEDTVIKNIKIFDYNDRRVTITPNAITFKGKEVFGEKDWQIITKFVGNPMEVIGEFDFQHNMLFWDDHNLTSPDNISYSHSRIDDNNNIYWGEPADLYFKNQLIFNDTRPRDISGVLLRIPKFIQRGFTISKEEHSKIIKRLVKVTENKYTRTYTTVDYDYDFGGGSYSSVQSDYAREMEILDSYLEY